MKLPADPNLPIAGEGRDFAQALLVRLYDLWRKLYVTVNERVTVEDGGTEVGGQPRINFIAGTGITLTISEDEDNGRVDVTISLT